MPFPRGWCFTLACGLATSIHLIHKGFNMTRKYIDCRDMPSDMNCSVALSADTDKELLEAAVQHAVAIHHHQDTPELRAQIKQGFKVGTPPLVASSAGRGATANA